MVPRGCVIGRERIGVAIELHSTSVGQNRKSRFSGRTVVDRRGIHKKALWRIKTRIFVSYPTTIGMPTGVPFGAEEGAAIWTRRTGSPTFGESNETPNFLRLEANCGGFCTSIAAQISRTARL